MNLPITAVMSSVDEGVNRADYYILKGVTDALFLVILKLPLSESRSRTMQG